MNRMTELPHAEIVVNALRDVSVSLDLDDTLKSVLEGLHSLVRFDAAGIYVIEPESRELVGAIERGYDAPPGRPSSLQKAEETLAQALEAGGSLTADVASQPKYIRKRRSTQTEMAVPITGSEGRIIGALNIESDARGAYESDTLALLAIFASGAAGAIERALLHRRILRGRHLTEQLALARRVMDELLPRGLPDISGVQIGALLSPWSEVGGDHYDFIPIDRERWAITITDVVGKGVPAALLVSTVRATFHSLAQNEFSLRSVLRKANRLFRESAEEGKYATVFYGELDIPSRRLMYINAGHPYPIHLRGRGEPERLETGGPPIGLLPDSRYVEGVTQLEEGDVLALYTDGVTEASNPSEEQYGSERLAATLARTRSQSASAICRSVFDDVQVFSGSAALQDDRTVVVLKATPR
jgi:sigma-B regulation protein RsbU (phosphoserine phosphatase)